MNANKSIYEFGPFRVDPVERLLTREGTVVPIPAKVFDTLLLFVRNSGRLLEKEALLKSIWPRTFVDEVNLAQCVSILRKALGERANSSTYIETVPKRGYRFVSPVTEIHEIDPGSTPQELTAAAVVSGDRGSIRSFRNIKPSIRLAIYAAAASILGLTIGLALRTSPPPTREVTPLTNFADPVAAPILSPDGRMLAFIRGGDAFLGFGQIWVKMLPNGEPVQLTRQSLRISTPAFSPDGSHIAFTVTDSRSIAWDTFVVSVLGGEPRRLLANASGLTWIGEDRVLFSEIKSGLHMGVVSSTENRSDVRPVYTPAHERAMAHYSYVSPDRQWVLVVEMDHNAAWQACRLVPFDGSTMGEAVGPEGACTSAAWSPDGRFMYFAVTVRGEAHLWRQRFPNGSPEQITFGPTQEEGIAIDPDGRSLITAIGFHQGTIWFHGPDGDQQVSSQGHASSPSFSADGRRIYYVLQNERSSLTNELWVTDRVSGKSESVITGFFISNYSVSADETEVVLAIQPHGAESEVWVAALDGDSPPRKIADSGANSPLFGPDSEIVFKVSEDDKNYLYKTRRDRSGRQKVIEQPIITIFSHSPDGRWVIALAQNPDGDTSATTLAIPVSGGSPMRVCAGFCLTQWSPDAKFLQIAFDAASPAERGVTFVVPLVLGKLFPDLPPSGFRSEAAISALPGVRRYENIGRILGLHPGIYAYVKKTRQQNLYRVSLN